MAGGRFVPIEDISVGDTVRSFDPVAGTWSNQRVLAVSSREADQTLEVVIGERRLRVTPEHVVFLHGDGSGPGLQLEGGARLGVAGSLTNGSICLTAGGRQSVDRVITSDRPTAVYSLRVAGNHTYAVTRDSVAVGDSTIELSSYQVQYGYGGGVRGSGGCFPAGTQIVTEAGTAELQMLEIGDVVVTTSPDFAGFAVPRAGARLVALGDGPARAARVVGQSAQAYSGDMINISAGGVTLDATGNHPFWVISGDALDRRPAPADVPINERVMTEFGRWVEARSLLLGDLLGTVNGGAVPVEALSTYQTRTTVYNVTIGGVHTYGVSSLGLLVHNKAEAESAAAPAWEGSIQAEMVDSMVVSDQTPVVLPPGFNTEEYDRIFEPGFKSVVDEPLSTLSIDVDTASYANLRRYLQQGQLPPEDAVRIEEMINYFSYEYPDPAGNDPFSFTTELSECPWNSQTMLLQLGLQAQRIDFDELPPNNLIFLLDVSGSMNQPNKLPLLQESLLLLLNELRDFDHVGIVVYAGAAGVVLQPTPCTEREQIAEAFTRLRAGGSTAGGAGIRLAYSLAREYFNPDGNNRVILATDGDFNVGPSSQGELQRIIEEEREYGIYLTVLGFGMGNYKDDRMETLADSGNGNYAYIDDIREARKVLVREIAGTLYSVANDVKIQIEFNPAVIEEYRIVGYENRLLEAEEFDDDTRDAGEMGAGHSVTVLYELRMADGGPTPARSLRYQTSTVDPNAAASGELMFLQFRYKPPGENESIHVTTPIPYTVVPAGQVSADFRLASAVASFGMLLRGSEYAAEAQPSQIVSALEESLVYDPDGDRAGLIGLVKLFEWLPRGSEE